MALALNCSHYPTHSKWMGWYTPNLSACSCLYVPAFPFFPSHIFQTTVTVAICCQGDPTTTASHSWHQSAHSLACIWRLWFGSLRPQLSFQQSRDFWICPGSWGKKLPEYWRHQHKSSSCPKSHLCSSWDLCLPPQLCTKMQVWMYYLDVFFLDVFFFFCILYRCYDYLCYLLVQMHQSVSVDEYCMWMLCHVIISDWQTKTSSL